MIKETKKQLQKAQKNSVKYFNRLQFNEKVKSENSNLWKY